MKNKELQKLLSKNNSNSGFTLTELLVGLIMGTIVIGGLGFGLVTLLRNTQTQTAFSEARNESSRALDFISDEVKRAVAIENTDANANGFIDTNRTVVFALDIPVVNGTVDLDGDGVVDEFLGTDNDLTTTERIVYFLQNVNTMAGTPWQGPLVLHRWGPPLDANGEYTDGAWQAEALIDGIDDTTLANAAIQCVAGQDTTPAAPSGFYACIQDDDLDGIVEDDATVDTNGDGVIDELDDDDIDNIGISAQLYLTSGIDIGRTNNETYTANTQVVARARVAPDGTSEDFDDYTMSFTKLENSFACSTSSNWRMRTDFGENLSDPDGISQWNPDPTEVRQPQPIQITGDTLAISSIPRAATGTCLNSRTTNGRESTAPTLPRDFSGNKTLGEQDDWMLDDNVVAISHTINFNDPRTFNGDPKTCTSYPCANSYASPNHGKVLSDQETGASTPNPHVLMLKHGSEVPDYGGYDANNNGIIESGDQPSLGEFLYNQSPRLADRTGVPGNYSYTVNGNLKPNQRIIAFEIGHETINSINPGVDFQDNIFIVSSDAFQQKHDTYDDGNGNTGSYPL